VKYWNDDEEVAEKWLHVDEEFSIGNEEAMCVGHVRQIGIQGGRFRIAE